MAFAAPHRYLIISANARCIDALSEHPEWGLCLWQVGRIFKVIDRQESSERAQITLLEVPEELREEFTTAHLSELEQRFADQATKQFRAALQTPVLPEHQTRLWLDRLELPVGVDDHGHFFECWQHGGFNLYRKLTIPKITIAHTLSTPSLDDRCGNYFVYRDLIECGETQATYRLANLPREPESYQALKELASNVLDPIWERFGPMKLTYGFSSLELIRKIHGRIAPDRDQHAAHEKRQSGKHVCPRLGAACDFIVTSKDMREVAEWAFFNTAVDRLYFYGRDRPVHVSFSNDRAHQFVELLPNPNGKRVPRVIRFS